MGGNEGVKDGFGVGLPSENDGAIVGNIEGSWDGHNEGTQVGLNAV